MFSYLRILQHCSPQRLHQFIFPPAVYEGSFLSTPSPACIVSRPLDHGHFDQCEVILHCTYDLQFLMNSDVDHLFLCMLAICLSSLDKCIFSSSVNYYFFYLVALSMLFNCMNHLNVLEVKPLSVTTFASIFSQSVDYFFILFYGFLCCGKLKFAQVLFVYFCFCVICLGRLTQENSAVIYVKESFLMSSCRDFTVSYLTLKSLSQFELTLVYGVKECSNFISLHEV